MQDREIEDRLSAIKKELAQIKEQLATDKHQAPSHPWDRVFGSLADSKGFEEAVRLGREYREAQRPKATRENNCFMIAPSSDAKSGAVICARCLRTRTSSDGCS